MPTGRPRSAILSLQLLLVALLACVVIVLVQALTAARSSQLVAERALADYANFAAWSYREHITMRLREAVDELLGPVNHGDGLHTGRDVPDARDLGHLIAWDPRCNCHRPRHGPSPLRFVGFELGTDTVGIGKNYAADSVDGWLADPPGGVPHRKIRVLVYSADESHWVNFALSRVARRPERSTWGYDVVVVHDSTGAHIFASRSMPTDHGDTVIYAVEYPPAALGDMLGGVLASSDLLPPSLVAARTNRDVIDLEVTDTTGGVLFRSRDVGRWELAAITTLPESYGGFRVRAQLRRELANALLIGGVPRSRVPLMLAMLLLAIVLSAFAAVQLRREVRFASERSAFVANVSHELRTPLTQVRLVLDTLRLGRGGDATQSGHALDVANREVLRLQHLVEGVLRFTRGSRHDGPLVRADLAREVRAVAAEFEPLAAPRGVNVTVTGDSQVDATLHTGALRQVLLNLLDNAVKYGGDGTSVTIDVRRIDASGGPRAGGVRVTVTDSGPGVPLEERERIWRAFERGGAAKRRAAGGSGIGLTIVREIAVEHGGNAWVEGAAGGGARFVVEFFDAAA